MKKSETDRDFLDLVKKTLDNYEEQYILGSWENFVKTRKRRRKAIFWRIGAGIAASLLIGWLGFKFLYSDSISHSHIAEQTAENYSNPVNTKAKDTLKMPALIPQLPDQLSQNNSASQLKDRITENRSDTHIVIYASEAFPDTLPAGITSPANSRDSSTTASRINRYDSALYKPVYKQPDPDISIENDLTDITSDKKFRFGVNISPGVTSTSTASGFNYSGGINADFAFLPAFRLSTGLQFEHLSVVNTDQPDDPSLPEGETKATLVDLDIPLNITWKFLVRKSTSYYVAGGISSVVYLSEKYANTSYSQQMVAVVEVNDYKPSITYQKENVKTTEQTTEDPLSTFDFASRVNIIFGFEQHLSSKLFLHVEPYLKIPISDQATQNIKYTTGGITCKISF